jgi:DNA polymerase III alpha subunit
MKLSQIVKIEPTSEEENVYDIHHIVGSKNFWDDHPNLIAQGKTISNCGRHAGGVLIADPTELERAMPIISVRGEMQTPWTEGMNFRNLEDNGFLKFDFLGLTLLKDVENCIRRILIRQGNSKPCFSDITQFFDQNLNCRYHEPKDQRVYERVFRGGAFCGVFQFTNTGARNFCTASKPSTIDELAAITAIYRPGPLKANVHRKYVESINSGKDDDIVDKHPIIKEILGPTHGFLVFQESWMILAQRLSGFTAVEADEMRKTLVKKSLDTNDKKAGERIALREKFVRGAKDLNGLDESVGNDLFDKIEFFSLYGFSKNHSVPYVIDSYYAAWLHTHYETDWLATILQSENGSPEGLKKAITEIKSYGYRFQAADINYSGDVWQYSEELEAFVPPLSSIKGVGDTAMEEIMHNRPYRSLDDLLYDEAGAWRHSKMNKTALRALCVIEALGSIRELKDGTLQNHRQLLAVLTDSKNYETLRKGRWGLSPSQVKKAEKEGRRLTPIVNQLIEEYRGLPDWSRLEKILNRVELTSSAPEELVFPQNFIDKVQSKDVHSVFSIPGGEKGIGWFCASEIQQKTTKKGKSFLRIRAIDNENNSGWIRVWGAFPELPEPYTLWISEVDNDANWGMATTSWKLKQIKAFE